MNEELGKEIPYDYLPNVLRSLEIKDLPIDPKFKKKVAKLLTPQSVIHCTSFYKPEIILPDKYKSFDDLLLDREKIRTLRLLPIKTQEEYERYHAVSKDELLDKVIRYFDTSPLALAINRYPYLLPDDLGQYLIWIKNRDTERDEILNFITKCMQLGHLTEQDIILFERPSKIDTKIVKGTFPEIRHIHFWVKVT